jgi:ADP-ribosylglycohydrolase
MPDIFFEPHFLLRSEFIERREEGADLSVVEAQMNGLDSLAPDQIEHLNQRLMTLPLRDDWPFQEPSDLPSIRAARPAVTVRLERRPPPATADKMQGAWLGRAAGCLLGKPFEGRSHAEIEAYLKTGNAYPLEDYAPLVESPSKQVLTMDGAEGWLRENITEMPRDDDLDYTMLGLYVLEKYGADFTTDSIGDTWLALLPYHMVFTAERIAYRNLVNGIPPNEAANWRNPYREWIGAQIRADGWAYGAAGAPEQAAEFAWRDARLSHTKNGIYGAMWSAAMIAAAFGESPEDLSQSCIRALIRVGLAQIPANCRLSAALNDLLNWHDELSDWRDAWDRINRRYGHYHWVHTINNALIVALGLLYGAGDFSKSIGIAVMGGWDTDCNGATVGSVLGAILGADALPTQWTAPLNDRVRSSLVGFDGSKFSDLAARSLRIHQQLYRP